MYDFVRKLKHKVLVCGNHDERLLHIIRDKRMNVYDLYNGTEQTVTEFFGSGCLTETCEPILPKYGKNGRKFKVPH